MPCVYTTVSTLMLQCGSSMIDIKMSAEPRVTEVFLLRCVHSNHISITRKSLRKTRSISDQTMRVIHVHVRVSDEQWWRLRKEKIKRKIRLVDHTSRKLPSDSLGDVSNRASCDHSNARVCNALQKDANATLGRNSTSVRFNRNVPPCDRAIRFLKPHNFIETGSAVHDLSHSDLDSLHHPNPWN